jgi:hypothetical protein
LSVKEIFSSPVNSWRHWGIILVIAVAFAFMPQLPYNDWERNTADLANGLNIYQNPNYVYPPWTLLMLWPYRLMTDVGARIASVLVVGWLAQRFRWSLIRLLAVVVNPFFIWTMLLSNADVLTFLLPVVLWESGGGFKKTLALLCLLVKPQGGFLLILDWAWHERQLTIPFLVSGIIVVFFSLLGSPPLLIQWLNNVLHPSPDNQEFWRINNVSLTSAIGFIPAAILVGLAAYRWRVHRSAVLLWSALLLSPYASNQSMIAPLALVSSWPATLFQYLVLVTAGKVGVYRELNPLWAVLFGIASFWLAERRVQPALLSASTQVPTEVSLHHQEAK